MCTFEKKGIRLKKDIKVWKAVVIRGDDEYAGVFLSDLEEEQCLSEERLNVAKSRYPLSGNGKPIVFCCFYNKVQAQNFHGLGIKKGYYSHDINILKVSVLREYIIPKGTLIFKELPEYKNDVIYQKFSIGIEVLVNPRVKELSESKIGDFLPKKIKRKICLIAHE